MDFNFKNKNRLKISIISLFPFEEAKNVKVTITNRQTGFVKKCDKHVTIL